MMGIRERVQFLGNGAPSKIYILGQSRQYLSEISKRLTFSVVYRNSRCAIAVES